MRGYIPTSKEITPKLIVIIVIFFLIPDGLLSSCLKISRWFINVFFGQTKNKKPCGSTRDIFSQPATKSKQTILPNTHFVKSEQLSFMGSVSKLVNHSLFLSTCSTAKKKNTCHVPYLPKKTCQGPKNWRDRDFIFTTENRSLLFTSCFALVLWKSKWLLPIDISEIRTCSTNEMGRLRDLNSSWLVLACQSQEDPRRRHFFAHF